MVMAPLQLGDRVYYVLPRSPRNGRAEDWYWAATVKRLNGHRVTVVLDKEGYGRARNTVVTGVTKTPPEGALLKPDNSRYGAGA